MQHGKAPVEDLYPPETAAVGGYSGNAIWQPVVSTSPRFPLRRYRKQLQCSPLRRLLATGLGRQNQGAGLHAPAIFDTGCPELTTGKLSGDRLKGYARLDRGGAPPQAGSVSFTGWPRLRSSVDLAQPACRTSSDSDRRAVSLGTESG